MEAIFSSKLFQASSNQDKIRSAIEDPINSELVKQLRTYLDDEYQKPEYFGKQDTDTSHSDNVDLTDDFDMESDEQDSPHQSHLSHSGSSAPSILPSFESFDDRSIDVPQGDEVDESLDNTDERQEEGEPQDSLSEVTEAQDISDYICPAVDTESLKSSLNSNPSTEGVTRVRIKQSELWIYYQDSINLNNLMGDVVDFINSSKYNYLEFNRLARSDNAIVFEITSVPNTQETIGDINVPDRSSRS